MDKTEESLIESRKKLKKYISNLELKIEVIQEVIKDTETLVKELKNAFIRVDGEIEKVEANKELYISFISFLLEDFLKEEEVNYEESCCIL